MSRQNDSRDYIRGYYGIAVKRGMRIVFDGKPGKITGFDGQYLLARMDGEEWHPRPALLHPTWRVAYPELGIEATE